MKDGSSMEIPDSQLQKRTLLNNSRSQIEMLVFTRFFCNFTQLSDGNGRLSNGRELVAKFEQNPMKKYTGHKTIVDRRTDIVQHFDHNPSPWLRWAKTCYIPWNTRYTTYVTFHGIHDTLHMWHSIEYMIHCIYMFKHFSERCKFA